LQQNIEFIQNEKHKKIEEFQLKYQDEQKKNELLSQTDEYLKITIEEIQKNLNKSKQQIHPGNKISKLFTMKNIKKLKNFNLNIKTNKRKMNHFLKQNKI
jgi:hypothetical protein